MVSTRPRVCNANMTNESTIGREERREKERERDQMTRFRTVIVVTKPVFKKRSLKKKIVSIFSC